MSAGNEVYVVGRFKGETALGEVCWEFQGVFEDEDEAVAACADRMYFVGPAILGEVLPHETREWPGCYYPKAEGS